MSSVKPLADRLRLLAEARYPEEFATYFTGTRAEFRDWMNRKTELDECHITNPLKAMEAWIGVLEQL
jgi:hypothetical protein